jgi:hypothetical protein
MDVPENYAAYVAGVLRVLTTREPVARFALEKVESWISHHQGDRDLWTLAETARFLRKKPQQVRAYVNKHGLPASNLPGNPGTGLTGDRLHFVPSEVRAWLASRRKSTCPNLMFR